MRKEHKSETGGLTAAKFAANNKKAWLLVFLLEKTESRACVMEYEQKKNTQPRHK
jgi:hypothetical protein